MNHRIEVLVAALASLNGFHDPRSEAFQTRNPLLLKAYNPIHPRNKRGTRIFVRFAAGFDNGANDLEIKCAGRSRTNLTPFSTLAHLVMVFGHQAAAARTVKNFLRAALGEEGEHIVERTQLKFFTDVSIAALDALASVSHDETRALAA